ncbi:hypothetical protein [Asaia bogorensis]|uniref:hypothetical protein n=1 Tax=Asaia bogorensis TaxID=91915 RepID=UPI00286A8A15|nr:hypothetical protein [Asaia bogorensis]
MQSIDLGAALALVAELDRWQRLRGIFLTPSTVRNWHPEVLSKLSSLGFFDLLKTDVSRICLKKTNKHWIQFTSGVLTDGYFAKKLKKALEAVMGNCGEEHFLPIYVPLVESMKNAIDHAYSDEDGIATFHHYGKRWWMAGALDEVTETVDVAFLDLGLTVPVTIPKSSMWARVKQDPTFSKLLHLDFGRTRAAMIYGISQTGEQQRGKGFNDIVKPANLNPNNFVFVISGHAQCLLLDSDFCLGYDTKNRFAGTLIRWHINLRTAQSELGDTL